MPSKDKHRRLAIQDLLGSAGRSFSPKQGVLINFLYRNYQKVAFMTITELANETKVSEATIVRLATLLGFDGYPSLQEAVQKIVTQDLTTLDRMQLSLEHHELDDSMQRMLKMDMRNLMRLYQRPSMDEVGRTVSMILSAERIVVTGFMSSAALAAYLGYALNRILGNVDTVAEDTISGKGSIMNLSENDLLIGFGFPRYPVAIVNLFRVSPAVPKLAFTDSGASPLAALADCCVFLPFELLAFVDSLAAPMSFLAGIVAEVTKRQPRRTAHGLKEFEKFASTYGLFYHQ